MTTLRRPTASRATPGRALLFFLGAALAGCGDEVSPDPMVRSDTVDGIEHTVAIDAAEREDDLEFLWSAPDEDAVFDGTEWANPTWISANEGHIAVLDPQLARVHIFTPDGERAGSFGRRGQGPGELSNPASVGLHGDSVLVASMLGQPALQWFGVDGSYRGSAGGTGGEMSGGAHFLPGSGIVRQVVEFGAGSATPRWEYLDLTNERIAFELPGNHPMQPHVADGGDGCWRRGAVGRYLAEVDCTFPLVRLVDPAGGVVRIHRIDREPERTPENLIEQAVDGVEASMRQLGGEVPAAMANEMISRQMESIRRQYVWTPVIGRVTGSTDGRRIVLVEERPEPLGGGPSTVHILADDGRYLARHAFDRRIRGLAASNTQLVVLLEDDGTGLRHMEAYRLP